MSAMLPALASDGEHERLVSAEEGSEATPSLGAFLAGNLGARAAWVQAGGVGLVASIWCLVLYFTGGRVPAPLYHPLLVSTGLLFLLQGILVLQPTDTPPTKKMGLYAHQVFVLGLGLPLLTAGVWVMWHAHGKPGAKHFISLHGILGALLFVLLWVQALFGMSTVWANGKAYGSTARAKGLWKYHRMSGYTIGTLLVVEIMLALWDTVWGRKVTPTPLAVVLSVVAFAIAFGVARRVQVSKFGFSVQRS
ncbi:hypothetical protein CBS9595_001412 [Malassezia furfur]|nr:hypothetical protein CBS9595_001412 [Malassezia furfur]